MLRCCSFTLDLPLDLLGLLGWATFGPVFGRLRGLGRIGGRRRDGLGRGLRGLRRARCLDAGPGTRRGLGGLGGDATIWC
jgi:hypothetical protein